MKSFLHLGCGPKRKEQTTAGFATWTELRFDIDKTVQPDLKEEGLLSLAKKHFTPR